MQKLFITENLDLEKITNGFNPLYVYTTPDMLERYLK